MNKFSDRLFCDQQLSAERRKNPIHFDMLFQIPAPNVQFDGNANLMATMQAPRERSPAILHLQGQNSREVCRESLGDIWFL